MNEPNILLARIETDTFHPDPYTRKWARVRGGLGTDWAALQARHRLLEEARRAGRLVELEANTRDQVPLAKPFLLH
jgi:hypothetical protein